MRYFLGFDLSAKSKLAIEAWREKALPHYDSAVPARNFHITSVFLGQVNNHQMDALCSNIDNYEIRPFSLTFDTLGFWSKPRILWLGTTHTDSAAIAINKQLSDFSKQAGITIQTRPYVPHITLIRKAKDNPPAALIEPQFAIKVDKLHLFESVSGKQGVHYPIRQTWTMNPFGRPSPR
ncbi:RNA 2',3'-cyclic phosphodiesterase [Aliiglaciecola sp. LCG003]|uniref:RNA 2',3'-cyclic phosphodiesterase n=1 Tax=Aliiglaciecola sp. LCG003 TaxID=3053655 RepID=UPI0025747185|nr:RNA 2',3'-cyclic phosphodiesterase [Aliiglaciecola sp. LCG003]WJG09971.1 RNA 2',3'-cyclic phosphodiesterase [Aliiglaciecola sp. LCG003]